MEPLIHFVVPFTALMLWRVGFKKALPLSLLAVIPDLDVLFWVHRSFSHSLIAVLGVTLPGILLVHRFQPNLYRMAWMGCLCVVSHPVMDLFAGYTPLLWPVYNHAVWIQTGLSIHIGSSTTLHSMAQLATQPITFQPLETLDAPLFTGQGLVLSPGATHPITGEMDAS